MENDPETLNTRVLECIGTCFALRSVMAAVLESLPNADDVHRALRTFHRNDEPAIANLAPPVQAAFDAVVTEMTNHLRREPKNPPRT